MKLRLLEYLRCPECLCAFDLTATQVAQVDRMQHAHPVPPCSGRCPYPGVTNQVRDCDTCVTYEVLEGRLRCTGCDREFSVRAGVPRLLGTDSHAPDAPTAQTSSTFGYLWSQSVVLGPPAAQPYHFAKMATTLGLQHSTGVVLDGGCGDGIDLVNHALGGDVEVIGVELSDGGCEASFARIATLPLAHVVQGDLRRLPFDAATFDTISSYGVLHHVASPPAAAAELARVLRPNGHVTIYLYEDFSERAFFWRWALAFVTRIRAVTTGLSPRVLYRLSQCASPIVYLLLTLPHRAFMLMPWTRSLAESFPYRHGKGPFTMAGDLYDRFSAPLEARYSRRSAGELLADTGLEVTKVAYERGWMVLARSSPK